LDLSSNQFNISESKLIAEGMKRNKIIKGFHFENNIGYVNYGGYLIVDDQVENSTIMRHRIKGLERTYN